MGSQIDRSLKSHRSHLLANIEHPRRVVFFNTYLKTKVTGRPAGYSPFWTRCYQNKVTLVDSGGVSFGRMTLLKVRELARRYLQYLCGSYGGGGVVGVSVPDYRGSGEIAALTDSQGKAERPNKQGRKESKQAGDLRKPLARCGHAMLLFSPLATLFCLSTVILTRLHTDTCAAARRRWLRCSWNYVNGLKWRGPNCVFLFVYLCSPEAKKKRSISVVSIMILFWSRNCYDWTQKSLFFFFLSLHRVFSALPANSILDFCCW